MVAGHWIMKIVVYQWRKHSDDYEGMCFLEMENWPIVRIVDCCKMMLLHLTSYSGCMGWFKYYLVHWCCSFQHFTNFWLNQAVLYVHDPASSAKLPTLHGIIVIGHYFNLLPIYLIMAHKTFVFRLLSCSFQVYFP